MTTNELSVLLSIKVILKLSNHPGKDIEVETKSSFAEACHLLHKCAAIRIRRLKKRHRQLGKVPLPIILIDHQRAAFILARQQGDKALILEPEQKMPQLISLQTLKERWSGQLVLVSQQQSRFDVSWFFPTFGQYKKLLVELLLFSLVLQLLALATPLFFQVVMNKVLVHQALTTLDAVAFILVISTLLEVVLRSLREYLYTHTANRIDIQLGLRLVQHLFALPLLYFKNRQIGGIVTRVMELNTIREFLTSTIFTLVVDVLFMFVFIAVMFHLSFPLTVLFLLSVPVYIIIAWRITPRLQQAVESQFGHTATNTAFLNETVSGHETLKSLALEPRFVRRWDKQTQEMITANYQVQHLNNLALHGVSWLQKIVSALVIWLGANEVLTLNMTIGQLIAFNMMFNHVSQPLSRLVELWGQFIQIRVAVDKLGDMLNLPPEQHAGNDASAEFVAGAIALKEIKFRYQPDAPLIIRGLSLDIAPGESIGIVGSSGSGKSTLARLLLRLYQPEQGEIYIDGQPIQDFTLHYLRQKIGVVLQENHLFNQSVRDNIAQSDPQASLEQVIHAATLAGAHDFIVRLPLGYDTILAEGGSSLSGGQRQRLAIARTLLANPKVLIFDEATSALDEDSQAQLQRNMYHITADRTTIVIAHRLSTVRQCSRIIVLHQGQIVEQGSHSDLLSKGQHYVHLWQLQQELHEENL